MNLLTGFAVCPAGLEEVLTAELLGISGFAQVTAGRGGAAFSADAQAIGRANLWARIPTRILVGVGKFQIRSAKDLLASTSKVAWEEWFTHDNTIRVDYAVGREAKLAEPLARNYAALLVKDGICDRFRAHCNARPSVDTEHPDIRIWAYADQNLVTLYIDTSGEPLFKRGWRQAKGSAPLRENLAAALIAMTPWDGQKAVLDPFCGSGTFLIEAIQRTAHLPSGFCAQSPRSFSAEKLRKTSPLGGIDWRSLRGEAKAAIDTAVKKAKLGSFPKLVGSDHDPRLIEIARQNAARALPREIADQIQFSVAPFSESRPHADSGFIFTNPPYGKRLTPSSETFERDFAEVLKKRFAGWQAWILSDDLKLESSMRLKSSRRIPVFNGDIECRWMRFDMMAGSMKKPS